MNQMDENYWKNLATQWIQSRSQQEQQQIELSHTNRIIPNASQNSGFVPPADNLDVADMEIEDVKDDEPEKLWNWTQTNFPPTQTQFSHHHQYPPPQIAIINQNDKRPQLNKPIRAPDPPQISSFVPEDAIHSLVDMDMDSDNDGGGDDSNSASSGTMMEAQKRKLLPHWIREGLEKMKREKEQESQRSQEEQRIKEEEAKRKKMMEEALLEIEREKAAKSKYVS